MGTVACVFSFLLISVHTNFSLSSPCTTTSTPPLLFLRCTQTHPHRKINTEIYLLKKKRYTNTPTRKQTQTEKQKKRQIGACDRSYGSVQLWIGAADRCSCGSMLVIGVVIRAVDQCCGSVLLWIDACDRSCGSVIGAVDRCL